MKDYKFVTPSMAARLEELGMEKVGMYKADTINLRCIQCPSITDVIDFLWERYGYFIELSLEPSGKFFASIEKIEKSKHCESQTVVVKHVTAGGNYKPDDAAILAIQHCISYMIKKRKNKNKQQQ